jgi:hypothetical protein
MKKISNTLVKTLLTFSFFVTTYSVAQARVQNRINYLPVAQRYEGKRSTSFEVFQALEGGALASEISDKILRIYGGKTVLILGDNFYEGQVIKIKKPMQLGIYKYETKKGDIKTVPVVR